MTIPEQLKNARLKAGLTQKELSRLISVDEAHISKYENGVRPYTNPTSELLQKWANACGIEITIKPKNC